MMSNKFEFIDKWLSNEGINRSELDSIEVTVLKIMYNTLFNHHVECIVRKNYKDKFNIRVPKGFLMMSS